ncbi:hypothetical protein PRZ48_003016 [Zasmidium cellare]|uniref:Uncharacterized protein n=1 Tax=Zasmidium cellare TaxID=395010 RepID=A0ABR0EV64_ZASCE|nr:hypothetical protein PRZ48_003016 [Zasmidium cellare]
MSNPQPAPGNGPQPTPANGVQPTLANGVQPPLANGVHPTLANGVHPTPGSDQAAQFRTTTHNAAVVLTNAINQIGANLAAIPHRIVAALQQIDPPQDVAGLHAQIIANSRVLYPILVTSTDGPRPDYVQVPDLFVVTSGKGTAIQATVLQPKGGLVNLPPGNDTFYKEVLIKGPTASSTRRALQALLHYTEDILSDDSSHMLTPMNQQTVAGPDGAWHYKK